MGARYRMLNLRTDCVDIIDADHVRRAQRVAFPLITCCSGSGILDVGSCGQGQGPTDQWGLQL
eukprot:5174937-Prymnesium_polylepis.2